MKTRDKILQTARQLFNEYGVPNVTLRRIALELKMSQGNLNYHFKHREDIIEALYFELLETFNEEKSKLDTSKMDFQFIMDSIKAGMEALFKYRFLMIDFNQNMRENPQLHSHFKELEGIRKQTYLHAFRLAIESKIMRSPMFEGEFEGLNERIRVYSDYWIASSAVYQEDPTTAVEKYSSLLVEMFFPYFTEEAQQTFLQKRQASKIIH